MMNMIDGHDFTIFQFSERNYSFCGHGKNTPGIPYSETEVYYHIW